jgi:hypothetical protein
MLIINLVDKLDRQHLRCSPSCGNLIYDRRRGDRDEKRFIAAMVYEQT